MCLSSNNFKRYLFTLAALLLSWSGAAQIVLTNVQTVNVTPNGFSLVGAATRTALSASATAVSVFADANGVTNLTGQVGVELYPLNAGSPAATNSYQTFLSKNSLEQESIGLGLIYARVSSCLPATTYYYRVTVTNSSGQSANWPSGGPLPAVTTAQENAFVLQSQQLLITVNDSYPPGSIVTLSTSNTPSILAAVVGDGAGNNQVFFSLNDLIAAVGGTNFTPLGTQTFTAAILGAGSPGLVQSYSLTFATNFSVGQYGAGDLGALATSVSVGEGAMLVGSTGAVPISVNSQSAVTGLSFVLNFPNHLFTAISVQSAEGAVTGASLSVLSPGSVRINLSTGAGANFQGSAQVAWLNLTTATNQPSSFVPISPQSPAGTNADASLVGDFSLTPGRAVIIGAQSLLDLQPASGALNLVLYGIPGDSYQIQSTTNLPGHWATSLLVPMTNLTEVVAAINPGGPSTLFRAADFNADPPILQTVAGSTRSLMAYGLRGTNYTLLTSPGLMPANWSPVLNYTLSNSFQLFTNLGVVAPAYYRLKR